MRPGRWSKLFSFIQRDAETETSRLRRLTGLLVALRRSSAWQDTLDLFASAAGTSAGGAWRLDTICWNAALSACQKGACWNVGLQALEEMTLSRVKPNPSSYNTLISACAESVAWPAALALLENADVVGRGAAISACGRAEQWQRAVALLDGYRRHGGVPDTVTFNAVLSALAYASQWQLQLRVLQDQHGHPGTELDSYGRVAVLSGLVQGILWQEAIDLVKPSIEVVSGKANEAELFMMNSAITACAKASQWDFSLQLLGHLDLWRLVPDVLSFAALLQVFQQRHCWLQALHLAERSRTFRSSQTMKGVIGVLGLAQQWQRAMMMLTKNVEDSKGADGVSFNATLWACEKAFQWQQCLSLLRWMEVMKAVPDSSSFLACASALQQGHWWQEALSLADLPLHVPASTLTSSPRMLRCRSFAVINWPGSLEVLEEMRWCGEADLPALDAVFQALYRASSWLHALRLLVEAKTAKMLDVNALQRGCKALEVQHQAASQFAAQHPESERVVWKHLRCLERPEKLDESQVPEALWGLPPILARNVLCHFGQNGPTRIAEK